MKITKIVISILIFLLPMSIKAGGLAGIPEVPKIPAFLPNIAQIPATRPMPIDGIWIITSIGKKVKIDSGRAYAIDGWLHLFVLDIQPGMVVQKNIMPVGPGQYRGEDLPLMGSYRASVQVNRSLQFTVSGIAGTISYSLMPVQLNNEKWFNQEMKKAGLISEIPSSSPTSGYQFSSPDGENSEYSQSKKVKLTADCENKVYDPATDTVQCTQ